jgi:hypothetical protein
VGKFAGTVAEVFQVTAPADVTTPIPPGGLMLLDLSYDSTKVALGQTEAGEGLQITYFNDFTQANTTENMLLELHDSAGATLPTADPGAYVSVVTGDAMYLNPAASSPGDGSFSGPYASWYLTSKPDGSRAELNGDSAGPMEFRPDFPGSYTVELVVYASLDGEAIYSPAASVTFTAADAP